MLALSLLGAVLLHFCAASAFALDPQRQISQYVHDTWNTTNGLPQDSVNGITQTPDGYLWIATQEGLARFDGVSFTNFDSHSTRELFDNFVFTLFTDRSGVLWMGASGGLLRWNGKGRFSLWGEPQGWPAVSARQIAQDRAGRLWVAMGSDGTGGAKGVVIFDRGVKRVLTTRDGLSSNVVQSLAIDAAQNVWLATAKGIDVVSGERVIRHYGAANGLPTEDIRLIYVDRTSRVWAGSEKGLSRLNGERFETLTTRNGLSDDRIYRLLEDRDGVLWIATGRGLSRIVDGKLQSASHDTSLADDRIFSLFEDREGSLWIGTHANGLHRLRSAKFNAIGTPEGLQGDSAYGIFEDREGRVWVGSSPGGVNLITREGVRPLPVTSGVLPSGPRSFRQDPDGAVWIAAREGFARYVAGRVTTYSSRDGLPQSDVLVTFRDRRGTMWIGTGRGLARMDGERIATVPTPRGFPSTIRLIFEDRRGRLWFGGGEGLAWWDGVSFHLEPAFADSHLTVVHEDADGTLWFGSWNQGLHRFRDGHLTKFTTRSGLFDDVAWSVLDDGSGSLWMGSNRGVYRVSKRDLEAYAEGRLARVECSVFGTSDGMRRRETNWGSPSALRAADGRLWFATTGGVVIVDPAKIRANPVPPPVVIERFIADEQELSTDGNSVLAAGTHNIEIHYAGLSLVSPDRVRYRYRLEGYDRRWIDAGARRTAYYTNIDPGAYTFRVIAANDDGVWNRVGATLLFRLRSYFWQTAWFYALVVLALVLSGFALNALRERQRRVRHQAFHDPLTGLPNRLTLQDRATAALAQAQKTHRSVAIMFLDLDGFKKVNDALGHAAGDELLQIVGARFRTALRRVDLLARIGGDEFAVLVASVEHADEVEEIAARLVEAVRRPFSVSGQSALLGVSIGIALFPHDGADATALLQAADRAMYAAKSVGGNAHVFATAAATA